MLADFTAWLLALVTKLFAAVWDFLSDIFVSTLSTVVEAVTSLIASIPVPAWLSGGLSGPFGLLDPGIVYVLTGCGIPQALLIIGGGYLFRVMRKIYTLGQW